MKDNLTLAAVRYVQVREELEEAILAMRDVAVRAFSQLPGCEFVRWCIPVTENIELLVIGDSEGVDVATYVRCIVPHEEHRTPRQVVGFPFAHEQVDWLPYEELVEAMTTDEIAAMDEQLPCAAEFEEMLIARMT